MRKFSSARLEYLLVPDEAENSSVLDKAEKPLVDICLFLIRFFDQIPAQRENVFIYTPFLIQKSQKGPENDCVDKIGSRRREILCVEKIGSRPRGILCVEKIGSRPRGIGP